MKYISSFFQITIGLILSLGIPFLGLCVTSSIDSSFAVIFSIAIIPLIGYLLLKSKLRKIGVGMFYGLIPLLLFVIVFLVLSGLH